MRKGIHLFQSGRLNFWVTMASVQHGNAAGKVDEALTVGIP